MPKSYLHLAVSLLCGLSLILLPLPLVAQPERATQIITAAVYYVAKFTRWDNDGKRTPTLCAISNDFEYRSLVGHLEGKNLDGKELQIARLASLSAASAEHCKLLFVGVEEENLDGAMLRQLGHNGVLTIGRHPSFVTHGGLILLTELDNRLEILINKELLSETPIRFSSELLSIAKIR